MRIAQLRSNTGFAQFPPFDTCMRSPENRTPLAFSTPSDEERSQRPERQVPLGSGLAGIAKGLPGRLDGRRAVATPVGQALAPVSIANGAGSASSDYSYAILLANTYRVSGILA
jgi:hypothetical protein